jgi:DNA-binding response OmpR family regulator
MTKEDIKVLIVDDEPMITLFIKDIVMQEGYVNITISHDSQSAVKTIKEKKPDIVFMDINISGPEDGITIIKNNIDSDHTVVFYISAYNDSSIINEALESHPYNYLVKPISENDIKISLGVACNRLCRKSETQCDSSNTQVVYLSDKLHYDKKQKKLFYENDEILLSNTETKVVDFFIQNLNINITCQMLRDFVWVKKDIADTTIRDAISKLRKKIPLMPIETRFGSGYILKL